MRFTRALLRVALPVAVLAACVAVGWRMIAGRPAPPERRVAPLPVMEVAVATVRRGDYRIFVRSRGTVQPRTESTLVPEVPGRVVEVSPELRAGGFFGAGEVLVWIDDRDYAGGMEIARAALVQARTALIEEQVRAAQAEREWKRLGEPGEPDPLVLRKPQLASAEAGVRRATAELEAARRSLERTRIVAPYAGRVLERHVDAGQYVSTGTVLARVFAVDSVEVRLPLGPGRLEWLDLPGRYRRDAVDDRHEGPVVRLTARQGAERHAWLGRIVRAEGAVDTATRQQFVIARIDDPYGRGPAARPPLEVGQFVEAEIEGRMLRDVVVVPPAVLRGGDTVFVVDADSRLRRRDVEVVWRDAASAVLVSGLAPGERLVTTWLPPATSGVEVRISHVDGEPVSGVASAVSSSAGPTPPRAP